MKNKYVDFISDEHLLDCIGNLHEAYIRARRNTSVSKIYRNKVDVFKMTFDSKFNEIQQDELIRKETFRQIDKSTNNSIGTFHEQVLGGIEGFEIGHKSGYDIKSTENTLFADIKNKHNTMNSSAAESLFQKLAKFADLHKKSNCYWVQILAKSSFEEHWKGDINGKEYSHSRVFKISGDLFYEKLTGKSNALFQLYKSLPQAIADFKAASNSSFESNMSSPHLEIEKSSVENGRSLLDQISFENYGYYLGFESL